MLEWGTVRNGIHQPGNHHGLVLRAATGLNYTVHSTFNGSPGSEVQLDSVDRLYRSDCGDSTNVVRETDLHFLKREPGTSIVTFD